jgi:hypothetical protein
MKIAQSHGLVIDCPDPFQLAAFYESLLGMIRVQEGADFVVIGEAPDRPAVAFQQIADHRPPPWPDPTHTQHLHLDVKVADLDVAESQVVGIGATRITGGGDRFRVFADPVGHPFCLVADD